MASGTELFYIDSKGRKQDTAIHASILENEEAKRQAAESAIGRAVKRGLTEAQAREFYGVKAGS